MTQRVSSTLIGRALELAALQSAYAARDAGVQTVLIAGPAGIGKSRLVAEFTARLESQTVLVGRCPELGNDGMPLAPFISIMRSPLRRNEVAELAERLLRPRPALGRFLPELAARAGAFEREPEPIQLFGEILPLLEQAAITQSVVLVLEDLHWADDSTQKLLAFLVANLVERQVVLICTYRPGGTGPLRSLVAELQRHARVRLVVPQPLTRYEVGRQLAALLGKEPAPGVTARVFQRSGGNPLFVEALSQSPDPGVGVGVGVGVGIGVGENPEKTLGGLNELLLVGQSALPAHSRAVLRLAAVAGSPADHPLLEAAADLPEAVLNEALRQLVDQQLLSTTDIAYEFRHHLIRQAIYDDLLPIERTRLHARLAHVRSAQPDLLPGERQNAELAHHAFAAGDLARAAQAFWQAAAIAERTSAQPERLHHLERLLELWDRVPDAAQRLNVDRLTVLEQAVDAGRRAGAIERGIHAADEALALLEEDVDPVRTAQLFFQRAQLKNQESGGGRNDLFRALELLPAEPPTPLRGQLLAELAVTLVFAGDAARAEEYASAAVEIAERLGASSLAARAYAHLGIATTAADPAAALAHFARAHSAAHGDPRTLLTWSRPWTSRNSCRRHPDRRCSPGRQGERTGRIAAMVVTAAITENPPAWDDAVQAWRTLEQPYEQAQASFEAARAYLAAGNRTAAQSALNGSVAIARTLGAAPLVDAVERLAARARLHFDRQSATRCETPDPDRFGLTRRELDVLRLVAQGLSNRQIAAELFISGNTAGVHVSRILGKLGVTSRTQAAAIAHRQNLLTADTTA